MPNRHRFCLFGPFRSPSATQEGAAPAGQLHDTTASAPVDLGALVCQEDPPVAVGPEVITTACTKVQCLRPEVTKDVQQITSLGIDVRHRVPVFDRPRLGKRKAHSQTTPVSELLIVIDAVTHQGSFFVRPGGNVSVEAQRPDHPAECVASMSSRGRSRRSPSPSRQGWLASARTKLVGQYEAAWARLRRQERDYLAAVATLSGRAAPDSRKWPRRLAKRRACWPWPTTGSSTKHQLSDGARPNQSAVSPSTKHSLAGPYYQRHLDDCAYPKGPCPLGGSGPWPAQ